MLTYPAPSLLDGDGLAEQIAAAGHGRVSVAQVGDRVEVDALDGQALDEAAVGQVVAAHTGQPAVRRRNEATVEGRLDQALDAMREHVTRGTFTNTQRDAALLLLLRVCIGLVRLTRRRLDATD